MEVKSKKPLSISINKKEESATSAAVVTGKQVAEVKNIDIAPKPAEQVVTMPPSIEELQARAEKTSQLVERYQTIKEKKAELDSFVILHDREQARIVITDNNGRRIETYNPKSIAQVVEIWKKDINEALAKAEQDVREIMNAERATSETVRPAA